VKPGDSVERGQRLVIVESMKMEIAVTAPHTSVVAEIRCNIGAQVMAGQNLIVLRQENGG
jgi:urea carboxylase